MASTYGYPVMFTKEGNVWSLSAHVTFGATGVPSLDTKNSRGICSFAPQSLVITGTTSSGSATITSVSSFAGIYTGMSVTGTGIAASSTIGTISASTGSVVMNQPAASAQATPSLTISGGRFVMQFGQQAAQRLDAYVKLLYAHHSWDMSASSASGSIALTAALAPAAPAMFVIANNTTVRTIPQTSTSGSTDCSLSLQFGSGVGTGFVAANPVAGEGVRILVKFGNLSAGPGPQ